MGVRLKCETTVVLIRWEGRLSDEMDMSFEPIESHSSESSFDKDLRVFFSGHEGYKYIK